MTNREFKVGDEVFDTVFGIGIVETLYSSPDYLKVNLPDLSGVYYEINGKHGTDEKYPSLYHLDEAVKLFPQWLEEVEDEIETTRWFIYSQRSQTTTNVFTFDTLEKCKERIVYCGSPSDIPMPFQVKEKRKIIREKQQ